MGHEKVPHGFGLRTGDRWGGTAVGICPAEPGLLGGPGRTELWTSFLFLLEDSTSDWHVLTGLTGQRAEGRTMFVCGIKTKGFWGLGINSDIPLLL